MSGIDHVGYTVSDFEKSVAFYEAALGTLGIRLLSDFEVGGDRHAGFGRERPFFWISASAKRAATDVHVAFTANSRAEVEAFYTAALAAGGRDNGKPGLRPIYHPGYFGAFVFDPDGNNIEAVHHGE